MLAARGRRSVALRRLLAASFGDFRVVGCTCLIIRNDSNLTFFDLTEPQTQVPKLRKPYRNQQRLRLTMERRTRRLHETVGSNELLVCAINGSLRRVQGSRSSHEQPLTHLFAEFTGHLRDVLLSLVSSSSTSLPRTEEAPKDNDSEETKEAKRPGMVHSLQRAEVGVCALGCQA